MDEAPAAAKERTARAPVIRMVLPAAERLRLVGEMDG